LRTASLPCYRPAGGDCMFCKQRNMDSRNRATAARRLHRCVSSCRWLATVAGLRLTFCCAPYLGSGGHGEDARYITPPPHTCRSVSVAVRTGRQRGRDSGPYIIYSVQRTRRAALPCRGGAPACHRCHTFCTYRQRAPAATSLPLPFLQHGIPALPRAAHAAASSAPLPARCAHLLSAMTLALHAAAAAG